MTKALAKPAFRDKFEPPGVVYVDLELRALANFIVEDCAIAARLVRDAGVQPR